MTKPAQIAFKPVDSAALAAFPGRIAVFIPNDGALGSEEKKLDRAMRGGLKRFVESDTFDKLSEGDAKDLAFPSGLKAEAVQVIKLSTETVQDARKAGAAVGRTLGASGAVLLGAGNDVIFGAMLRAYKFVERLSKPGDGPGQITVMVDAPTTAKKNWAPVSAVVEGVYFTRDLVNEPANVLTTKEFATRLKAMSKLGMKVEVLEEADLKKLGMGALLGVGQGSESPSKVVVMEWAGGKKRDKPLALVGKGVVFDTGGISIKPAAGMEQMTMDMGGAGVVAGVMHTLARRKAKANVVGLVGLVENMPDGKAQRPGDIVTSMKGDTIEVINTDAEGRLVLADVMWYAQERFKPRGMIDLATLTGAVIIALGHENAGVFANDDDLANAFLNAAAAEGEGAWRMPLGSAYDKLIKSTFADMKNTGGRGAGSITAAQFLQRFVKEETPWIHLDIAGVASLGSDSTFSAKGATGWGVAALDRLVKDMIEG